MLIVVFIYFLLIPIILIIKFYEDFFVNAFSIFLETTHTVAGNDKNWAVKENTINLQI